MVYLVFALAFLLLALLFNISGSVLLVLKRFLWSIIISVLSLVLYIVSIGFGLTWIAFLFGVI